MTTDQNEKRIRPVWRHLSLVLVFVFSVSLVHLMSRGSVGPVGSSASAEQPDGTYTADIVEVTADGRIICAQSDGITVSRVQSDGTFELLQYSGYEGFEARGLYLYEDTLLAVGAYAADKGATVVEFYDLSLQTELTVSRATVLQGVYDTAGIIDDCFMIVVSDKTDGGDAYIDTVEGGKQAGFTEGAGNGGVIVAKIDLSDGAAFTAEYTSARYAGLAFGAYCSPYALYLLTEIREYSTKTGRTKGGCDVIPGSVFVYCEPSYEYEYEDYTTNTGIICLASDTLRPYSTLNVPGDVSSGAALRDDGEHLFVFYGIGSKTTGSKPRGLYLDVYDGAFNLAASVGPNTQPDRFSFQSVRYYDGFCYYFLRHGYSLAYMLHVIDLSDPAAPRYCGEFDVGDYDGGFNVQAFGEGGTVAVYGGKKEISVALSDISAGRETIDRVTFDGNAEQANGAVAVFCDPGKNIFAFPAECPDGAGYTQGAYIYGVVAGHLEQRAFLTELPDGYTALNAHVFARKKIRRVVRVGDYLCTVADGFISAYKLPGDNASGDFEQVATLDARIRNNDQTVTFMTEESGGAVYLSVTLMYGDLLKRPPNPPAPDVGYLFVGWFKADGAYVDFKGGVTESFVLYPRWVCENDLFVWDTEGIADGVLVVPAGTVSVDLKFKKDPLLRGEVKYTATPVETTWRLDGDAAGSVLYVPLLSKTTKITATCRSSDPDFEGPKITGTYTLALTIIISD
ncbi:MAG: beta-propeller domain-containing protein [Firmicutes bacterium]|nr:beta-propeller domain-containing protein [Bacillota bacterium]